MPSTEPSPASKPLEGLENQRKLKILVFDYDGTLTQENGPLLDSTILALKRVFDLKLAILGIVSGRDLLFLEKINERVNGLFSFLVAENGAVTMFSDSGRTSIVGKEWSEKARAAFSGAPFHIQFSEVIGSARRENIAAITELAKLKELDCKLVPNKNSIMICPPNVDKGTGVSFAVGHYGTASQVFLTCFGDGENDVALFGPADYRVAVLNGVPALKKMADVVTKGEGGVGVEEYLRKNILKGLD